tara:strand:- start:75 stop:317 length:243 start_codon:yes stop_codon:yes gene_type:complete
MSYTRTIPSLPEVTIRFPSGLYCAEDTLESMLTGIVVSHRHGRRRSPPKSNVHIFTVPSVPALAIYGWKGENCAENTSPT